MKVRNRVKAAMGLTAALMMGMSSHALAAQEPVDVDVYQVPMHFVFDGEEFAPPEGQQGFISEGSTYVPLRFISYSLGKAVQWDGDTYTVTVADPKDSDKITINEYKMNTKVSKKTADKVDKSKLTPSTLQVYKEKVNFVFNGVEKPQSEDLPSYIVDGNLYVPMRFFSESVGKTISWDPETYSVSAVTEKAPEVNKPESTPTSTPAPTAPSTSPVTGGGGAATAPVVTKPSYDSITSATETKLKQLEATSESTFKALYQSFLDDGGKNAAAIKSEARQKLAEVDSQFEQIMSDTTSKLQSNDYDTSVIDSYREAYQQKSADLRAALN